MHLAGEVADLDEGGELAVARRGDLRRSLAQLRRRGAVAEVRVELVLALVRDTSAGLDSRDSVLRDRQPAPLRVLAKRDVVVLRAREVLEDVPVALRRHDTQVEAKGIVRNDRRLRVTARHDLGNPVAGAKRVDQRCRVARSRDEVEVAHGLAAAADASGLRDGDRCRMRLQLGDDTTHSRQRHGEEAALLDLVADAGLECLQDLLLALRAHARQIAQPAGLCCRLQAVEGGDAELRPDPGSRLRANPGKPQEVDNAGRDEPTALREGVHLAVLHDLDDLRLDRLPDSGQLLRLPVERELGDRQRRLPYPSRCTTVRDDLERLLLEDLREVCEKVELIRERAVAGQRLGHPAMIRRCLARFSASQRTTSARTSRR